MTQNLQVNSTDLLTCFFEECESRFRFLEQKHGYLYLSGLAEYRNHCKIIVPYGGKAVDAPFLALTRYEKGERAIEILYGEQNFSLEMFVYIDAIRRLSLRDLMSAARSELVLDRDAAWILEKTLMQEILADFADAVSLNAATLLKPSERLIERSLTMRDKLTEQAIRAYYKETLANACAIAAASYLKNDYRSVVEVLQPYEKDLSASDLKKLKLAREKLQNN